MFSRSFAAALVLTFTACGPQNAEVTGEGDDLIEGDASLTTTEVKVATTGMTVWLKPYVTKTVRSGQTVWILKGRASVTLDSAMSFVPDDGFCQTNLLSARTFEIVINPGSEANTLLSGLPLFVNLIQPGPKQAILKFVLEPRFVDATGSSKVWLNTEIKPIYVAATGLTYRGKVRANGTTKATVGGAPATVLQLTGTTDEWNVDVGFDQLSNGALTTGATFTLDVAGTQYTKKAAIAFGVKELDLQRTDDAYNTWPSAGCSAATQACMNAAGADAYDYEACGAYRPTSRCNIPSSIPQIGASPDDRTVLDATLAQINAALPATKQVKVIGFWIQNAVGGGRPSLAQAVKAWQQAEQTPTTIDGERTASQVNPDLDLYAARTLVPAIQKTVLQQSFKAMRLKSAHATWDLLYFSTAARVMVIQLVDTTN